MIILFDHLKPIIIEAKLLVRNSVLKSTENYMESINKKQNLTDSYLFRVPIAMKRCTNKLV
jgi:hypothetical protein